MIPVSPSPAISAQASITLDYNNFVEAQFFALAADRGHTFLTGDTFDVNGPLSDLPVPGTMLGRAHYKGNGTANHLVELDGALAQIVFFGGSKVHFHVAACDDETCNAVVRRLEVLYPRVWAA